MTHFLPGLALCEAFYHEAVRPILNQRFSGVPHAAGRLDEGSEVLGFDTPRSMDHDWGPANLTLFLADSEIEEHRQPIIRALSDHLPHVFRWFPADFAEPEVEGGSRVMGAAAGGPVAHKVTVTTVRRFFLDYLGVDPLEELQPVDWLLIPQQRLRTVASGRIFHDGLNTLTPARDALRWYPDDLWYYLLACQWRRISQEEAFMARCGEAGDELGSRLVAGRMVIELMRLCFLMERQYWPYAKWFGTAFSRLDAAAELMPIFQAILDSQTWQTREQQFSAAYLTLARWHNALELTDLIAPEVEPFFDRPYLVPHADRFATALHERITDDVVRNLPEHIGAVAQFVDSTDVLDVIPRCRRLGALYR